MPYCPSSCYGMVDKSGSAAILCSYTGFPTMLHTQNLIEKSTLSGLSTPNNRLETGLFFRFSLTNSLRTPKWNLVCDWTCVYVYFFLRSLDLCASSPAKTENIITLTTLTTITMTSLELAIVCWLSVWIVETHSEVLPNWVSQTSESLHWILYPHPHLPP